MQVSWILGETQRSIKCGRYSSSMKRPERRHVNERRQVAAMAQRRKIASEFAVNVFALLSMPATGSTDVDAQPWRQRRPAAVETVQD